MKFKIASAMCMPSANHDNELLKYYPSLRKYGFELCEEEGVFGHTTMPYIHIYSLEELKNLIHDLGDEALIVSDDSITIYDYYIE